MDKKGRHELTDDERKALGTDKILRDDPGVDRNHPVHQQNLTFLRNVLDGVTDVVEQNFPTTETHNLNRLLDEFPYIQRSKLRAEFLDKARKLPYYGTMEFGGKYLIKTPMGHLEYVDKYVKACELSVLTLTKNMNKVVQGELDKMSTLSYAKRAIKSLFRRK